MNHPSHKDQLNSIKRIEGQLRGVAKMIDQEKYCIDILDQIKAIRSAISTVEGNILKKHLKACVKETLSSEKNFDEKMEELLKTLKR